MFRKLLLVLAALSLAFAPASAQQYPGRVIGHGGGITYGPSFSPTPPAAYDPDAQAIINAFTTPPTTSRANLINTEVLCEKAAGSWALEDAYYFIAAADSQAATINWRYPSLTTITVGAGSPVFTADRGYAGNGSTEYLNTNYNPATFSSPQWAQNSASVATYTNSVVSDVANGTASTGAQTASGGMQLRPWFATGGNGIAGRLNDATFRNSLSAQSTRLGMSGLDRHQSTTMETFRGASQVDSISGTSAAVVSQAIFILAGTNNAGAVNGATTDRIAWAAYGASLGGTIWSARYSCVLAYLTAIGAN